MKFIYPIVLILSVFLVSCSSNNQNPKVEGFEIPLPENWIDKSDMDMKANLSNYKLEDEQIAKLLKSKGGSVPIAIYAKYDPSEFSGPIPTIQVLMRKNRSKDINAFKKMMALSLDQMASVFSDFEILSPLKIIEIDGFKALEFISQFNMPYGNDSTYSIRSWTYAIPSGNHFYQVNFSDTENEDSEQLYNELINQLKLRK